MRCFKIIMYSIQVSAYISTNTASSPLVFSSFTLLPSNPGPNETFCVIYIVPCFFENLFRFFFLTQLRHILHCVFMELSLLCELNDSLSCLPLLFLFLSSYIFLVVTVWCHTLIHSFSPSFLSPSTLTW